MKTMTTMTTLKQLSQVIESEMLELFAIKKVFSKTLSKWQDDGLKDKYDHNYFEYFSQPSAEEFQKAVVYQKERGLNFIKLEGDFPLENSFGLEEDITLTMALKPERAEWKTNSQLVFQKPTIEELEAMELKHYGEDYGHDFCVRNIRHNYKKLNYLGAYLDDKLVGTCYYYCFGDALCMDGLLVDDNYRKQYIGTSILAEVLKREPNKVVFLHADEEDTPKEMYAKMGFETVARSYGYLKDDLSKMEGDSMRDFCIKKLTQSPQDMDKSNAMWNKRAAEFAGNMKKEGADCYMEFLKKHIPIRGHSFLDIGCGAGKYLKLLLDEGAMVEGLEPSTEMIKEARKYLTESKHDGEKVVFHNVAFQDFVSEKQYDYIFISNSPVISYYENYAKILKLAKKGIFIGSWLGNQDSLLEKISKKIGKLAKGHGSGSIRYFFELLLEDDYFPSFDTFVQKGRKKVNPESLYQRYASWFYGAEYTEEEVQIIKNAISEYLVDGMVQMEVGSAQGMLFVDLMKRLD